MQRISHFLIAIVDDNLLNEKKRVNEMARHITCTLSMDWFPVVGHTHKHTHTHTHTHTRKHAHTHKHARTHKHANTQAHTA